MTKENNLDSQMLRAKENLKLDHGGPSKRQASGTSPPMKGLGQGVFITALNPNYHTVVNDYKHTGK